MSTILSGLAQKQGLGAISFVNGTSAPDYVDNGLPFMNDGRLALDFSSAQTDYKAGLGWTANGRITATDSTEPYRYGTGAAPMGRIGRLNVIVAPISHYSSGVPYAASGSIAGTNTAPS